MSSDKEFQRTDAATGNERRPTVDSVSLTTEFYSYIVFITTNQHVINTQELKIL